MADKTAKPISKQQDYPILKPFRLNGKWHHPKDKTISLLPSQANFLLLNGKLGKPGSAAVKQTETKEVSK
ncbi:hypothetical protein L3Q72_06720 [Vibrio sp. JC009]|uniref:hypothetical protein n=1 Tax=Vibrio sp. JC009 TaxID=2912314 RepID=UPI0023AE9482|nr:hypothetical protein [Vibrio sp. JC009]WED23081.1 hypothetical protein L3Q72_06720 [Vibrio sp. JC009]